MKITIDLPDKVLAAAITIIVDDLLKMKMTTMAIPTDELKEGAVFSISTEPNSDKKTVDKQKNTA